ncbi:hypothetical protein SPLC1_S360560 [Arthrospira platensis C1]|nr:hypothetical protein SPLC1_S360540 [Arthrospira platensis C1]EKD07803.1 hypothetical protein SPLC1_S360550 [Arthrospira platensis C1]EKD07804.1 hypothetical protein SPLC1_S360560 [Arthrospira platensis C1]
MGRVYQNPRGNDDLPLWGGFTKTPVGMMIYRCGAGLPKPPWE